MTFTYDLAASGDALNIAKVRLELGDTVASSGVRPSNANLTDEEILLWLNEESGSIMKAVARACFALSRMWANVASISVGPESEQLGKVSDAWQSRGDALVKQYGGVSSSGGLSVSQMGRNDGYHQGNPSGYIESILL